MNADKEIDFGIHPDGIRDNVDINDSISLIYHMSNDMDNKNRKKTTPPKRKGKFSITKSGDKNKSPTYLLDMSEH